MVTTQDVYDVVRASPAAVAAHDKEGWIALFDTDYVIGREPAMDADVRAGRARPLVLADSDRTASRVHAAVRLHAGTVWVTDLGSANGTYVVVPGAVHSFFGDYGPQADDGTPTADRDAAQAEITKATRAVLAAVTPKPKKK